MSYIPVTTELSIRLNNKPLYIPVDKNYALEISTLKSAFGQSAIGLKYAENHRVKVVNCKNNKLYPPKSVLVSFVLIRESENPQVDIPDNFRGTRLSQTLSATNKQSNNIPGSTSSSPDNQPFPEVSYQEIEELGIDEFRIEADLITKLCQ